MSPWKVSHEAYFSRELMACKYSSGKFKFSSVGRAVHFLKSAFLNQHDSVQHRFFSNSCPSLHHWSVWAFVHRSQVFASGEIEIYASVPMLFGSVRWAFLSSWWRPRSTLKKKTKQTKPLPLLWWFERSQWGNIACSIQCLFFSFSVKTMKYYCLPVVEQVFTSFI